MPWALTARPRHKRDHECHPDEVCGRSRSISSMLYTVGDSGAAEPLPLDPARFEAFPDIATKPAEAVGALGDHALSVGGPG